MIAASVIPIEAQNPSPSDAQTLLPGVPVERELAGGQTHSYLIPVVSGQYLRVQVLSRETQPSLQLFGPNNSHLTGAQSRSALTDLRTVALIAGGSGDYRLEIRPADAMAKPGRYEVKVIEQRPATERDQLLVAAEGAEWEGRMAANASPEEIHATLAILEKARDLWRRLGEAKGELRVLTLLSRASSLHGEYFAAEDYARQGIPIAQSLGDRYQQSNLLMISAQAARRRGEIQQALDLFTRARQIFAGLSARMGEASALMAMSEVYLELGEPQRALEHYLETQPVAAQVGFKSLECQNLNGIGTAYQALGDLPKALEYHERALVLARQAGERRDEANSLIGVGEAHRLLGNYQQAMDCYRQSQQICRQTGFRRGEAAALNLMGELAHLTGDEVQARQLLTRSLEMFREMGLRRREPRALHSLAQLNLSQNNLPEARQQIEAALEILESSRAGISTQERRLSYFAAAQNTFALYIELLMRLHERQPAAGFDQAALEASERSRARSLLDLLVEARADIRQGVSPELLEEARALQGRISDREAVLISLLSRQGTEKRAEAVRQEIAGLTAQRLEVEARIRADNPRYAALTQPRPLTLGEIQGALDAETVLLEYALGAKRSYLWVVTTDSLHSIRLPGAGEIEAASRRWLGLLPKSPQRRYRRETELAAAELSRIIIQPAAAHLVKKRLLIVADGTLQYVPFAALPKLPNLIDDHEIVSLPSASVLAELRRDSKGRRPAEKQLAVFSDPVFQADDPRVQIRAAGASRTEPPPAPRDLTRSAAETGLTLFERLPFARQEAEAITGLVPAAQQLKKLDFAASRADALESQLEKYRIIHFATHGLLNSQHPELSGLVLSLVDERGQPQDGFLRLNDLYNLKLNADLVVLSACRTALGKEIRGEGLVGLTRGFMYAGAARVVSSLWSVNDAATAELMKRFYRALLIERKRPAAALRAAQLSMSRDARWSAPYYWSGFILQGDWK